MPPWNSISRCSSTCLCFLQQLQAAVLADAVREMDDVVPFAQLEKAVDHAAQPAPRGAGEVAAVKQLAAADQHDPLADQPKAGVQRADRKVQAAGFGETALYRKTSRSRSTSASVWQTTKTSWPSPAESSSSRTLPMSPLKRSTLSIFSWQVVSIEPAATAAAVIDGKR